MAGAQPLSGSFELLNLNFTALQEGETDLTIVSAVFNETIAENLEDGKVVVSDILLGDVSGNGSVDVSDAILVLRHIVGLTELTERQLLAANMTGNKDAEGKPIITVADAILILRRIVGLD